MRQTITQIRRDIERLEQEKEDLLMKVDQLKEEVREKTDIISQLQRVKQDLEDEVQSLRYEIREKEKEISRLEDKVCMDKNNPCFLNNFLPNANFLSPGFNFPTNGQAI